MKLNKEIPEDKLKKLKMLVLDSDGVSIVRGTEIKEMEGENFVLVNVKTRKIENKLAEKINKLKKRLKICISSGRSLLYLQGMYDKILGGGTILMAENGNLMLKDGKLYQLFEYKESYFEKLAKIKEEIKNLPISGFEPKQFILTVHASVELPEIYEIVRKHDLSDELKVMWNGEAFDIQEKTVSKGEGLKILMKKLKIGSSEVIAIGDRVNDKELLDVVGIGISIDKSQLEAEYWIEWQVGDNLGGENLVDYLIEKL